MVENLKEERLAILKMIQDGKISSDEGLNLLNALEEKEAQLPNVSAKWIKIRVLEGGKKSKVNVNIPIALVDVGLKIAHKFSPELKDSKFDEIDLQEVIQLIKNGAEGKIVDIDSEDGEKVEIYVE